MRIGSRRTFVVRGPSAIAAGLLVAILAPTAAASTTAFDGHVAVLVVDGGTRAPVGGADVRLTARGATGASIQQLEGPTGADGRVTFDGVARGDAGLALSIVATRTELDARDGCTFKRTWAGSADATAASEVAVIVETAEEAAARCDPPGPGSRLLRGTVLDRAGRPFPGDVASVVMGRADGGTWSGSFAVAPDGSFAVPVEPWGTAATPATIDVVIDGPATSSSTDGTCTFSWGLVGRFHVDVALADGTPPPALAIVARSEQVAGVCAETAVATGPSSTTGTPQTATVPPTDGIADASAATKAPWLPALVVTLGIVTLLMGWEIVRRDG